MPGKLDRYKAMTLEEVIRCAKMNGGLAETKRYNLAKLESRAKEKFPIYFQEYINAYKQSYIERCRNRNANVKHPERSKIKDLARKHAKALAISSQPFSEKRIRNKAKVKYGKLLAKTYIKEYFRTYNTQINNKNVLSLNTKKLGMASGKRAAQLNIPLDLKLVEVRALKRGVFDVEAYLSGYKEGYDFITLTINDQRMDAEKELPNTAEIVPESSLIVESSHELCEPLILNQGVIEDIQNHNMLDYFANLQDKLHDQSFILTNEDEYIQPSNGFLSFMYEAMVYPDNEDGRDLTIKSNISSFSI